MGDITTLNLPGRNFEEESNFIIFTWRIITVCIPAGFHNMLDNLRRVSPDEEHHAFILATARDLAQGKSEQEWKAKWLSCQATFVRLDSQEDEFWRADKLREAIGAPYDSM